ncbi:hypothetical protein ABPG72_001820 [Tetrahymena utriculariae]
MNQSTQQTIYQDQKGYKDVWNILLICLISTELALGIVAFKDQFADLMNNYQTQSYIAYKIIFCAVVVIFSVLYFFRRHQNLLLLNILIYVIIIDTALRFIAQAKLQANEWNPQEIKDIFSLFLYINQFTFPIILLFFSMRRKEDIRVIVKQVVKNPTVQQNIKEKQEQKLDHKLFFMS